MCRVGLGTIGLTQKVILTLYVPTRSSLWDYGLLLSVTYFSLLTCPSASCLVQNWEKSHSQGTPWPAHSVFCCLVPPAHSGMSFVLCVLPSSFATSILTNFYFQTCRSCPGWERDYGKKACDPLMDSNPRLSHLSFDAPPYPVYTHVPGMFMYMGTYVCKSAMCTVVCVHFCMSEFLCDLCTDVWHMC